MACTDVPGMSYMALYIVSMHIVSSNQRTSTHWKLNMDAGKVEATSSAEKETSGEQVEKKTEGVMMKILSDDRIKKGKWTIDGKNTGNSTNNQRSSNKNSRPIEKDKSDRLILDCGRPVNSTHFDHLRGIINRKDHPFVPEPEVAMMFRRKKADIDMVALEEKLKKLKQQKPHSAQVYNQIGNFWRIRGHTNISIECFRKALHYSPNDPDILLNLARVLYILQYLDDAIFLTRKSLEKQTPEQNPWLQHFTLGEILKTYGHDQEAVLHFRHTLDLNPGFKRAQAHLREMEVNPHGSMTYYTLFIIVFLVLGVVLGVITSVDLSLDDTGEFKSQRHFNRAMAMRSIKLGINPKVIRMRKTNIS